MTMNNWLETKSKETTNANSKTLSYNNLRVKPLKSNFKAQLRDPPLVGQKKKKLMSVD
jgi:hypothetical protein